MQTRLLAFFDATIAAKKSCMLENPAKCRIDEHESAADPETNSITLRHFPATLHEGLNIDLLAVLGEHKRRDSILAVC